MNDQLALLTHEYRRHKSLADRALDQLSDERFFQAPEEHVNSVAIIVKHIAGNFASRWSDFLTTDGEKPSRDRDNEFVLLEQDNRAAVLAAWERGWSVLFQLLAELKPEQLEQTVIIRQESHTVNQALLRGLTHAAYHVGQILYLVRLLEPQSAWLTIEPGKSGSQPGNYLKNQAE